MKSLIKLNLVWKIFIAMILGSIVGAIWGPGAESIEFIGTIWLNMIKMFIVPVVIWDQRDERGRRFGRSRCDR